MEQPNWAWCRLSANEPVRIKRVIVISGCCGPQNMKTRSPSPDLRPLTKSKPRRRRKEQAATRSKELPCCRPRTDSLRSSGRRVFFFLVHWPATWQDLQIHGAMAWLELGTRFLLYCVVTLGKHYTHFVHRWSSLSLSLSLLSPASINKEEPGSSWRMILPPKPRHTFWRHRFRLSPTRTAKIVCRRISCFMFYLQV